MLDFEAINKAVRDCIVDILGDSTYPVVKAFQDAPRPAGPYASVHIGNSKKYGEPNVIYSTDKTQTDVPTERQNAYEIFVDVNFYRADAQSKAQTVHDALHRESVLDILADAGIGLGRYTDVKNLPTSIQSKWEQRAMFDLTLHTVSSDSETVTSLESATIAGVVAVDGNELSIDINV